LVEEHLLAGARVQLVCALVKWLKGTLPPPPQPHPSHPNSTHLVPCPSHSTWNAGLVVGRSAKAATNNNLFGKPKRYPTQVPKSQRIVEYLPKAQ
jgi:hypothetical protein